MLVRPSTTSSAAVRLTQVLLNLGAESLEER